MKKFILMALVSTLLQTNAHALLLGKDYNPIDFIFFLTTSLPTVLISGEEVDYNTPAGKALLVQEAQNVMEGKKSLIIKDDEANKEGALTALEKAQIILNGLSE